MIVIVCEGVIYELNCVRYSKKVTVSFLSTSSTSKDVVRVKSTYSG